MAPLTVGARPGAAVSGIRRVAALPGAGVGRRRHANRTRRPHERRRRSDAYPTVHPGEQGMTRAAHRWSAVGVPASAGGFQHHNGEGAFVRRISLAVLTIVALVLTAATPATAATRNASIRIDHRTSEIYLYDGSPDGTGPAFPAATARGEVRNCPTGVYFLSASLIQDGLPTYWATGGLGAGEIVCDGGTASISMGFYRGGPVLHPGRATVRFELHDAYVGTTLTEKTRTVRIPR
ncbi:Protein of unknown function [Micromonospora lupini str. Lupac 08]|uniref:Uncharacterized protein n=1 Tax=Micromonospora lupini str. Lupac 08 TaxID=1150864 RepID=I0KYE3_9ACTN|nr:Protein of unknown function [Micromonospora lupini str. Lupac 08]